MRLSSSSSPYVNLLLRYTRCTNHSLLQIDSPFKRFPVSVSSNPFRFNQLPTSIQSRLGLIDEFAFIEAYDGGKRCWLTVSLTSLCPTGRHSMAVVRSEGVGDTVPGLQAMLSQVYGVELNVPSSSASKKRPASESPPSSPSAPPRKRSYPGTQPSASSTRPPSHDGSEDWSDTFNNLFSPPPDTRSVSTSSTQSSHTLGNSASQQVSLSQAQLPHNSVHASSSLLPVQQPTVSKNTRFPFTSARNMIDGFIRYESITKYGTQEVSEDAFHSAFGSTVPYNSKTVSKHLRYWRFALASILQSAHDANAAWSKDVVKHSDLRLGLDLRNTLPRKSISDEHNRITHGLTCTLKLEAVEDSDVVTVDDDVELIPDVQPPSPSPSAVVVKKEHDGSSSSIHDKSSSQSTRQTAADGRTAETAFDLDSDDDLYVDHPSASDITHDRSAHTPQVSAGEQTNDSHSSNGSNDNPYNDPQPRKPV